MCGGLQGRLSPGSEPAERSALQTRQPELQAAHGHAGGDVDAGDSGTVLVLVRSAAAHEQDGAQDLGIGVLAKPYSEKVMKNALDALDRHLQGKRLRKLPPQLTLYETA